MDNSKRLKSSPMRIGLLGFGVVGGGVVELLANHPTAKVTRVAVKDPKKKRDVALPQGCVIGSDVMEVATAPDVDMIVEVMGGTTLAKDAVFAAMKAGKHIVTANKPLLSQHMDEIEAIQKENPRVHFMYEAAVCGGIPIVNAVRRGLALDKIVAVAGIMNGTSNYIVTHMFDHGAPFDKVLKEAQELGYAEADPAADVEGWDARSKLIILARLAFGAPVKEDQIYTQGMSQLLAEDFSYAKMIGRTFKVLGVARRLTDEKIGIYLSPALVSKTATLGQIDGVMNCVALNSTSIGDSVYVGAGAGRFPTANSVVADVEEIIQRGPTGTVPPPFGPRVEGITYESDFEGEFYLRYIVVDCVGVLHTLCGILVKHNVSIHSCLQTPIEDASRVPFAIVTEKCRMSQVVAANKELQNLKTDSGKPFLLSPPFSAPYF